jgi:hypothetical protein
MKGILTSRAVLRLIGEDARTFLNGVITQDVTLAPPGAPLFSALLTPQGKILFDFFLTPADGGYYLDCLSSAAPALLKRLLLYKLRAKIELTAEPGLAVCVGDGQADPRLAVLPKRAIVAAGSAPAVDEAYDALRLAAGAPEFGRDFGGEEVFLLDVNYDALNAVSFKKGCFVGQEVTSRMKRKGEIRKRTYIAQFDGPAPDPGSRIAAGDMEVGEILSGREGIALALLRVDRLAGVPEATVDGRRLRLSVPAYLEGV